MAWFTGYDGWSFYVHQCVLLTLDGDPVWLGRGWDGVRISVEMNNCYFSAAAYRSLETHLRDATPPDATGLVNRQRIVKSETEIAFMRNAARIVEKMYVRIETLANWPRELRVKA